MLYFAYGSNMDWSQMRERCPTAQFVCVAKLKDHHLAFTRKSEKRGCGVSDVIPERGHDVWGVVYEIDERDLGRLDKCEGFVPGRRQEDNAYFREERRVYRDGNEDDPLLVSVYFAIQQPNPPLPNDNYKRLIVGGARYWHLPDAYIQELERIEVMP
jgi:gamma-glutamylcyclotransferase (GGCT)/AIG2-like uncharacterized protein YtfP